MGPVAMTAEEIRELVSSLYETWYVPVVRFAARRLGNVQSAEDLVQEAFMQLYRELIAGRAVENPRAWTFCVVRRQVLHQLGVVRREADQHDSVDVLDRMPGNWMDPAELNDDPRRLRELLSILTKREEEVVHLRLAAMKYREIADALQISESSVNTLLIRALKKMRHASSASKAPSRRQVTHEETRKPLQ